MHSILIFLSLYSCITIDDSLYLSSFVLVKKPSTRLADILKRNNLSNPVFILEYKEITASSLSKDAYSDISVKKTLNSIGGVYLCINLENGHMYVGSSAFKRMYNRFRSHLYLLSTGSKIVKNAVLKYGNKNFAFVVIETVANPTDKTSLLALEQSYIDCLKPSYNILQIAGSVLNSKWSLESRRKFSAAVLSNKKHMERISQMNLGKTFSKETRDLIRNAALGRKVSLSTRIAMSKNNNKSVKVIAYIDGVIFKTFDTIASAALFFFQRF